MTKEESIEILEKIDVKFFISGMTEQKNYIIDKADEVNIAIATVLSALKEEDKEIQFQKDINKTELNRHKNTEKSLKGIIKKQNRIIDLMAEFLNKRSWREHQLKNDTCYCCKIEYGADDCKDCIKQYFENEAKELINK